jgi:ActR/RegA family two-component response regulator
VKAPTRALIVEDIENWQYTLERAARRAGASEVVVCKDFQTVKDALRKARFDVALLDIGLDPEDDLNVDGIKVLEAIREIDGSGTRCILVTGWAGDRLDLQAQAQQKFGVDWSYMKEKYDAHAVIAKLNELLEQASKRRLSQATPMANLGASVEPFHFEGQLVGGLSPNGGVKTLYTLATRLLASAIPIVAMHPEMPMEKGPDGTWVGVYWSRALAAAVAVGLAPVAAWEGGQDRVPRDLARLLAADVIPDLIESTRERNIQGRLWELPGVDRDRFGV